MKATVLALGVALAFCGTKISYAQQETDTNNPIVLPPGFSAETFYVGIPNPDGIAVRSDGALFVLNEAEPQECLWLREEILSTSAILSRLRECPLLALMTYFCIWMVPSS